MSTFNTGKSHQQIKTGPGQVESQKLTGGQFYHQNNSRGGVFELNLMSPKT